MTDAPSGNVFAACAASNAQEKATRRQRQKSDSDHADAFKELEPDIGDLERAAELCLLMVQADDFELTFFTVRQLVPMARALRKKYYSFTDTHGAGRPALPRCHSKTID